MNHSSLLISKMLAASSSGFSYFLFYIFMVPTVFLSLALLATTLASRPMTASMGALFLMMLTSMGVLGLLTLLEWSVSPLEIVLMGLTCAGIPLGLSYLLFLKVPFFDRARTLPLFITHGAGAIVALLGAVLVIYLSSAHLLGGKLIGFDSLSPEPGGGGRFLASVECQGVVDFRMWLLDPSKKKVKRFSDRRIIAPMYLKKDLVQYDRIKTFQALTGGMVTLEHWVMEPSTSAKTRIGTSTVDWKSMGSFYSKGTFFFILPVKDGSSLRIDITLNAHGKMVKAPCHIRLPQYIKGSSTISGHEDRPAEKGKRIDIRHSSQGKSDNLCFLVPCVRPSDDEAFYYALDEVDLATGRVRVIDEITPAEGEIPVATSLSEEGKKWLLLVKKGPGRCCLYLRDSMNSPGAMKTLWEGEGSVPVEPCWLPGNKKVALVITRPGENPELTVIARQRGRERYCPGDSYRKILTVAALVGGR